MTIAAMMKLQITTKVTTIPSNIVKFRFKQTRLESSFKNGKIKNVDSFTTTAL